ncbi:MAG: AAA family ATPase [Bacteroidales bacterium]|nr:AAA family ATPase [Bacteroidales bacterium]
MIESIKIDNFRGIHRCKIEGLTQVNLFFGKNNCGKSSLLESLFWYAASPIRFSPPHSTPCVPTPV